MNRTIIQSKNVTTDYTTLANKPAIGGVTLTGDKSLADLGIQPAGNYLTEETDPDVYEWAKAENKPSYTYSEVGAEPANSNIQSHISDTDIHLTTDEKTNIDNLISDGDGTKYLADDGGYDTITVLTDYDSLSNRPAIGGTTLTGDQSLSDLGIQAEGDYLAEISAGTNAKTYAYTRTQTSDTTATQGSLEIETSPTTSSANLITSGAVYTAVSGIGDKVAKITAGTTGKSYAYSRTQTSDTVATEGSIEVETTGTKDSTNLITSGAVYTKLDKIETGTQSKTYAYTRTQTDGTTATQGSLEVETSPTDSSANLITSGAVYTSSGTKLDKITAGTNAKTYAYTRTQTSDSTATQGSIEVETVPVASSTNLVTSGGVYSKDIRMVETSDEITSASLVRLVTDKIYHQLSKGTETTYESANTSYISIAEINTNTFVVAYRDGGNSGKGTAGVLTVNGSSVALVDTVVFEEGSTTYCSVCKVDTNKAVVCYKDAGNSNYGTACVLSFNGTDDLTAGAPAVFESASTTNISVCPLDTNKAIVCYTDVGNSNYGTANVLTVTGTDVAGNTPNAYCYGLSTYNLVIKSDTNKAVVTYVSANMGYSVYLSVSGTDITANAPGIFSDSTLDGHIDYLSVALISSTQMLIACRVAVGSNYYGKAKVGAISTMMNRWGGYYTFESKNVYNIATCKLDTNRVLLVCKDYSLNYNYSHILDISGNEIKAGARYNLTYMFGEVAIAQVTTDNVITAHAIPSSVYGKSMIITRNDATGYALASQFSTNELSGNAQNINVVPYIPLT